MHQILLHQERGFQSPRRGKVQVPQQKPRDPELTQEQSNKQKASLRGKVEHSIGRVKVFRMLQDRLWVYKQGIKDLVMELRCTLHNFKVACKT